LLDEVAFAAGWEIEEVRRLRRLHNTARKYRIVCDRFGLPATSVVQLRALGRNRACLYYCDGVVHRGDDRATPTMSKGWHITTDGSTWIALGCRLEVGAEDLKSISHLYESIAERLVSDAWQPPIRVGG
jgi:hypothetical protein